MKKIFLIIILFFQSCFYQAYETSRDNPLDPLSELDPIFKLLYFGTSYVTCRNTGSSTGETTGADNGSTATSDGTGSSPDNAVSLTLGDLYKEGTLSNTQEEYWFTYNVIAGDNYTLYYEGRSTSGYSANYIYRTVYRSDKSETYVTRNNYNTGSVSWTALTTETVYIKITKSSQYGTFGIRILPNPTALTEGNIFVTKNLSSTTNYMYFSFSVISGLSYTLYWDDKVEGTGTKTADVQVTILHNDFTQAVYKSQIDSGYSTINSFIATATETIYVKVEGKNSSTGSFSIRYQQTATALSENAGYIQGNLTSSNSGTVWYSINLTSGKSYTLYYEGKSTNGYTADYIYRTVYRNDLSTTYVSRNNFNTGSVSWTALTTETAYIKITKSSQYGTFGIKITQP